MCGLRVSERDTARILREYYGGYTEKKRGCKTGMSDGYARTISPYSHNTLTKEQMKDDLITRLDTVNTANRLVETWK